MEQPTYTACVNCGPVSHFEYVCPCECHGAIDDDAPLVGGPDDARRFALDGEAVDIAEFIECNGFAMPDIEQIDGLDVGEEIRYGGGAAPIFTLTRIPDRGKKCPVCGSWGPTGQSCGCADNGSE